MYNCVFINYVNIKLAKKIEECAANLNRNDYNQWTCSDELHLAYMLPEPIIVQQTHAMTQNSNLKLFIVCSSSRLLKNEKTLSRGRSFLFEPVAGPANSLLLLDFCSYLR